MSADHEKRVALVIGNDAYVHAAPLRNPTNDAEAIAEVLDRLGFEIITGLDLTGDQMDALLVDYARQIGGADAALLYFAGHGLQVRGQNYLIPVDADIREEFQLKRRAFALNDLLELMVRGARARSGLVFLDACRDDPFARTVRSGMIGAERSRYLVRSGLAKVEAMQGSFIAFATEPDNVADDGTGDHSPFTEALLAHMETPDISIGDMMIEVRNHVWKATNGRQRPWDQSSLTRRFCFKVTEKPPPLAPSVALLLAHPPAGDKPTLGLVPTPAEAASSLGIAHASPPDADEEERSTSARTESSESRGESYSVRRQPKGWALVAVLALLVVTLSYGAFETTRWYGERRRHVERETKRAAEQAKLEADAAAAREREREAARLEEGARLAFENAAAAKEKRRAEDEEKQQRREQCEQALRLYTQGMQYIDVGNVSGARLLFERAAHAGLWRAADAVAGTYDPEQLSKFGVVGVQPDIVAAQEWYEKARVLQARRFCEEQDATRSLPERKRDDNAVLELFRAAYISGDGLTYVVIMDGKEEHTYRYGDESRSASKKDPRAYTLYACNERHFFILQNPEHRTALLKATVVKFGEPRFLELDAKYVSGCNSQDIKSAIPQN